MAQCRHNIIKKLKGGQIVTLCNGTFIQIYKNKIITDMDQKSFHMHTKPDVTYNIPPKTELAVAIGIAEGYNFSQSSDFTFFTYDNQIMRNEPIPMFMATRIAPMLNHSLETGEN